jgi:hypothetical protein
MRPNKTLPAPRCGAIYIKYIVYLSYHEAAAALAWAKRAAPVGMLRPYLGSLARTSLRNNSCWTTELGRGRLCWEEAGSFLGFPGTRRSRPSISRLAMLHGRSPVSGRVFQAVYAIRPCELQIRRQIQRSST